MNVPAICLTLAFLLSGCATPPTGKGRAGATLPPRLDSYFEEYCDYTGNMGIGFSPDHTWDYEFRHRLKGTADPELKRLFVLQNLYRDVEFALRDLDAGKIRTGQAEYRPLTADEWLVTRGEIQRKIDDLTAYASFTNFTGSSFDPMYKPDPSLDLARVDNLRQQLRGITNAPAANKSLHSTPR
jgi:hypothetical protein